MNITEDSCNRAKDFPTPELTAEHIEEMGDTECKTLVIKLLATMRKLTLHIVSQFLLHIREMFVN